MRKVPVATDATALGLADSSYITNVHFIFKRFHDFHDTGICNHFAHAISSATLYREGWFGVLLSSNKFHDYGVGVGRKSLQKDFSNFSTASIHHYWRCFLHCLLGHLHSHSPFQSSTMHAKIIQKICPRIATAVWGAVVCFLIQSLFTEPLITLRAHRGSVYVCIVFSDVNHCEGGHEERIGIYWHEGGRTTGHCRLQKCMFMGYTR